MSAVANPAMGVCIERQTLGAVYLDAIRDINALLVAQGRALVEGGAEPDQFEAALTRARERRDDAKVALLVHIQAHGC